MMNLHSAAIAILVLYFCFLGEATNYRRMMRDDEDVCQLDMKIGRCRASFPKYFHNRTSGQCEKFYYGGCDGNGNRFPTKDMCEDACVKKEKIQEEDPCSQPMIKGRCRGAFRRYFYDQEDGKCKQFIYGGCGKNQNNFKTMTECQHKCSVKPRPALQKEVDGLNDVKVDVQFSLTRLPEREALLFMHKDISVEDEYVLAAVTNEGKVRVEVKSNGFVSRAFIQMRRTDGDHRVSVSSEDNSTELAIVDGMKVELQKVEEHLPRFFWKSHTYGSHWNDQYNRGYDLLYIGGMWECDVRAAEFTQFEGCISHVSSNGVFPVALHFGQKSLSGSKSCSDEMVLSVTVPDQVENIARISSCGCSPDKVRMIPFNMKNGKKLAHYEFDEAHCKHISKMEYYKQLSSSTNSMIIIGLSLMVVLLVVLAYIKRKQAETMALSLLTHVLIQQKQESDEEADNPPSYEDQTYLRSPSYDPPPPYEELVQAQAALARSISMEHTPKEQTSSSEEIPEETKPLNSNA